jgi:hypothetical protein
LNRDQLAILQGTFRFLERSDHDYASRRLAEHFLLNCNLGIKVAQIARLVGVVRSTASRHQRCSSRQVVQTISNRLAGKYPGKLLPRYAGPIAEFLFQHPDASRDDLLQFIEDTFQVQASFKTLHEFLNKYGLDRQTRCGNADHCDELPSVPEVLDVADPASRTLVPEPSQEFFLHHPVRRCFRDAARGTPMAGGRPGVLRR